MKNSASNSSNAKACAKQALQMQAQQMVPTLTALFSSLNYNDISHQRLSQQSNNNNENDYQGLTRAQHLQFGRVMI